MSVEKVLYHPWTDTRQNPCELSLGKRYKIQQQAASVACLIPKKYLTKGPFGFHLRQNVPSLQEWVLCVHKVPLGEQERFYDEKTAGSATAFLVTDDTVLTAAHAVCTENSNQLDMEGIENTYVVFNYHMENSNNSNNSNKCKTDFSEDEVYTIKRVIQHDYTRTPNKWSDWALAQLDRPVKGKTPFKLCKEPALKNQELYMLGFPNGLPLKLTDGATIMNANSEHFYECDVNAWGGNSGSPLCNADTSEVSGILCVGKPDYVVETNYKGMGLTRCVPNRMKPDTQSFEQCQRVSQLTYVHEYVKLWSIGFKLKKLDAPVEMQKPGLYTQGMCLSASCTSVSHLAWKFEGIQTLHIEDVVESASCKTCQGKKFEVKEIGFFNCKYKIEGALQTPLNTTISKHGKVTQQKIKIFGEKPDYIWSFLKITTTPL